MIRASPTIKLYFSYNFSFLSLHPCLVEANPFINLSALSNLACNYSVCCLYISLSAVALSKSLFNPSIFSLTTLNSALSSYSSCLDFFNFYVSLFTVILFGSISLNALAKPSTAKTHLHKPPAASEIVSILEIYIRGSWVNFSIRLRVFDGTRPLSRDCNLCKKAGSANYFLATAQLGYLLSKIMTAFNTTSTPCGGVT